MAGDDYEDEADTDEGSDSFDPSDLTGLASGATGIPSASEIAAVGSVLNGPPASSGASSGNISTNSSLAGGSVNFGSISVAQGQGSAASATSSAGGLSTTDIIIGVCVFAGLILFMRSR
jgi:hypothetical protein